MDYITQILLENATIAQKLLDDTAQELPVPLLFYRKAKNETERDQEDGGESILENGSEQEENREGEKSRLAKTRKPGEEIWTDGLNHIEHETPALSGNFSAASMRAVADSDYLAVSKARLLSEKESQGESGAREPGETGESIPAWAARENEYTRLTASSWIDEYEFAGPEHQAGSLYRRVTDAVAAAAYEKKTPIVQSAVSQGPENTVVDMAAVSAYFEKDARRYAAGFELF